MKTILLVEDDKKLSIALSTRLQSMGFIVATAQDAINAMAEVNQCRPDAMLIDINLPGGDGFIVAERVRTANQATAMPFIFITASRVAGLRERAKKFGAVGFLEKPFGAAALAEAVNMCLDGPAH